MTPTSISLHQYLTKTNPEFLEAQQNDLVDQRKRSGTTKNAKWPEIDKVGVWEDFNLPTLRKMFDGRLNECLNVDASGLPHFPRIPPALLRVYDECAIESVIIKWTQTVVLEALEKTSQDVVKQRVEMVRGGQALLPLAGSKKDKPDWAGISDVKRINDKSSFPGNILPGETKPSWVWNSTSIGPALLEAPEKPMLWPEAIRGPLQQVTNYCGYAHARYGYIISDQELVAIRVGRSRELKKRADAQNEFQRCRRNVWNFAHVEYRRIPWEASGDPEELSVNLALWFLHLLAANNGALQDRPYGSLTDEKLLAADSRFAVPLSSPDLAELEDPTVSEQLSSFELRNLVSQPGVQTRRAVKRQKQELQDLATQSTIQNPDDDVVMNGPYMSFGNNVETDEGTLTTPDDDRMLHSFASDSKGKRRRSEFSESSASKSSVAGNSAPQPGPSKPKDRKRKSSKHPK